MSDTFRVHAELTAFEKSGDDMPMRIGGVVSTDEVDQENERIIQEGIDFRPFLSRGWFNDNHSKETAGVVGYPTDARYVRKGERLPNGKIAKRPGWWAEGYLLNTEKGREIWALTQALQNTPRKLGFSIEGKVVSRHPRDSKTVTKAEVRNVAVTHCPVNAGTELQALVKALAAGHAVGSSEIGTGPGDGAALRTESLDDDLFDQEWGELAHVAKGEEDDDEEVAKSVEAHKASGEFTLTPMDEISWFESWADPMAEVRAPALHEDEARLIVKSAMPHLTEDQVEQIINNATGA